MQAPCRVARPPHALSSLTFGKTYVTAQNLRFAEKMREQLRFLQRSCAAFDSGAEDEALRIATALRVIFHNTPKSTSLIAHLGLSDVKMLSSSRGHGDYHDYLSFRIDFSSPEPVKTSPILGAQFRELPLSTWWATESVFVHDGEKFSRKMIVLSAANKDGGAHVDSKLSAEYEALAKDGAVGSFVYQTQGQKVEAPIQDAHLVSLRQLGYELLHSSELVKLA